ncbi:phage repressor protein CI [Vibrio sp. HN007]|uniref:phage repressor protein CI n=1 Tax=Vibrio iocasae TaxID=3098914 RepID=UPI0035D44054
MHLKAGQMDADKKIPPYEYLKGSVFVDNLKKTLGCRSHQELENLLGVPKSTFSTWAKHDRTSHELIVRLHLALGIPVKKLALPESELYKIAEELINTECNTEAISRRLTKSEDKSLSIQSFKLSNGQLVHKEALVFDRSLLNSIGVRNPMAVTTEDSTVIIDKEINQAVSGTYLVDMDGLMSLNEIQRLPGKQLAIAFNGSTLAVDELSVKIVGRVVLDIRRKV